MESQAADRSNCLKLNDHQILVIDFEKLAAAEMIMTSQKNEKRVLGYVEVQSSKLDDHEKLFIQEIDYEGQSYCEKDSTNAAPVYMVVPGDNSGAPEQNMSRGFQSNDINSSLRIENMHVTLMDDDAMIEDCIDEPLLEEYSEYVPVFLSNNDLSEDINANDLHADLSLCVSEKEETDVLFIPCSKLASTLKLPKNDMELSETISSEQIKSPGVSEVAKVLSCVENVELSVLTQSFNFEQQSPDIITNCNQDAELSSDSNPNMLKSKKVTDTVIECNEKFTSCNDNIQENRNLAQGLSQDSSNHNDSLLFPKEPSKKLKIHESFKNLKSKAASFHSNMTVSTHENIDENEYSDTAANDGCKTNWEMDDAFRKNETSFFQCKQQKRKDAPDSDEFVISSVALCEKGSKSFDVSPNVPKKSRVPYFLQKRLQNFNIDALDQTDSFIELRLQVPSPEPTFSYQCSKCDFKCHYLDNFIFHEKC